MDRVQIQIDSARIAVFCRRWGLRELSIFGSALTGAMHRNSDVDILIELPPGQYPDIDEWEAMRSELSKIFARPIDLISRRGINNPFLRHHIMSNREILYAA